MRLNSFLIIALFLVALFALPTAGDVFNMPSGLTSLETVPVGDVGNAPDARLGYGGHGAVGYSYNIGKYEVTAGQYCQFLNAVAATDTYGLYNPEMDNDPQSFRCGILRGGEPGNYTYSVAPDWANRPVNHVSFWDSCRFTNWLGNGQPTGQQGPGTTETGAYTLNGYVGGDGSNIIRNVNATWALPSEDEWYKAAYYKGGGMNAGYWDYPTCSNTAPSTILDPTGTNNANYSTELGVYTIGAPYYFTEVGAFAGSPGPYGTFNQAGNVEEWNESIYMQFSGASLRGARGSSFLWDALSMRASGMSGLGSANEIYGAGFRVVLVPEPGCTALLFLGAFAFRRRKPS